MEHGTANKLNFFDERPADLLQEHRQVYLMINAIAKRVRQLQLGDRALALPASGTRDPLYIAQEEFLQDKLTITERAMPVDFRDDQNTPLPGLDLLLGLDDPDVSFDLGDDED